MKRLGVVTGPGSRQIDDEFWGIVGLPFARRNRWRENDCRIFVGDPRSPQALGAELVLQPRTHEETAVFRSRERIPFSEPERRSGGGTPEVIEVPAAARPDSDVLEIVIRRHEKGGRGTSAVRDASALGLRQFLIKKHPELEDRVSTPWPDGRPFAAYLSHDVDILHWGRIRSAIRRTGDALRRQENLRLCLKALGRAVDETLRSLPGAPDSSGRVDLAPWVRCERRAGVTATYFFAAPKVRHADDPIYALEDRIRYGDRAVCVAELIQQLCERGAEIGLHSSLASREDPALVRLEKRRIEEATGGAVAGVRQHYLDISEEGTLATFADAGFAYDSSVGSNDTVGVPTHTSYPFRICRGPKNTLWEVPITVHDVAVEREFGSFGKGPFRKVENLIESIKGLGGVCGILWHNYSYRESSHGRRFQFYRDLIDALERRGAWIAPIAEIREQWTQHVTALRLDSAHGHN